MRSRFSGVRARTGRRRRLAAGMGTLALAVTGLAGAPPASAVPGTVSHATGTFLSASLLGIDLATLAAVNGADAGNSGGAAVVSTPGLDVTALSTVNLDLGTLSLPMGDLIRLGVLNQYAQPAADGSSYGAAGAVTDQGSIKLQVQILGGAASISLANATVGPDVTPLPAPVITAPTNGTTTGPTSTITGTGAAGATVTVMDGSTTVCAATVPAGGAWTCSPAAPLARGSHTLTATQADGTTTSPASAPATFTVVTQPRVITGPTNGSVTTSTPAITGTGTSGGSVVVADGSTQVCTANVADDGTWSCTPTAPLADGTHTLTATQTVGGVDSPPSAPVTFTVSTGIAALLPAPTITGPTDGSTSASATPPVSGTGQAGATITVTVGSTTVCTAVVGAQGTWSCTPGAALSDGAHTVVATQADSSGTSLPSAPVTFVVDTTAVPPFVPPAPTITSPADGSTTADATPAVSGTGQAGATVTVTDGTTTLCTAVVGALGTWSCTPGAALSDGTRTLTATQADSHGTSLPSAPVRVTVDTTAAPPTVPPAPTITSPADGSTTGTTPTIAGTGQPGATVTVADSRGNIVGTTVVDPDGSWSLVLPQPLSPGSHAFTATQTDADGNTSVGSAPVTFTVVAETADAGRSWLPTTGASVVTRLVGALALLVVGADLVLVAATRRHGRVG